MKTNPSWTLVWCQTASHNWFKTEFVCLVVFFPCGLSLKCWNSPSCHYPQFLPPTQCLNKPSREDHRSHQQLLRSILCLFSSMCFCSQPVGCTPTTSLIFLVFSFSLSGIIRTEAQWWSINVNPELFQCFVRECWSFCVYAQQCYGCTSARE